MDEGIAGRVSVVASQDVGDFEARALLDEDRDRVAWHTAQEIRQIQADIDRREQQRRAVNSEIDWMNERAQERIARLEWVMEAIAKAERKDGRKSLRVPGVGTWSTREVPASVRVQDEDAAIVWAREFAEPDLVQVVEKLDKRAAGKFAAELLAETGELMAGMERVPERISVSYKLEAGE